MSLHKILVGGDVNLDVFEMSSGLIPFQNGAFIVNKMTPLVSVVRSESSLS